MADDELDPLDRWLNQQGRPLPPPPGTFELISKRARRRKVRKALVSVASAAAVAAAVGIAIPLSSTLHLTTKPTGVNLAAGASASASASKAQAARNGVSKRPAAPATTPAPGGSSSAPAARQPSGGGYLPPNFRPTSVTWDSTSSGWIIGPAGTPGHCANANPDICTSVARTTDSGRTWHGLPAPTTTGVTGLRFLNGSYGWAFGPQLWATSDGGASWHQVNTGGRAVTDLETVDGRAYALFASCGTPAGASGPSVTDCASYTLETTAAGSGSWTPVSGVPAGLGGASSPASAVIGLAGATVTTQATGYLIAPDGMLYAGPVNGGAWHSVSALPCLPGGPLASGQPGGVLLAPMGATASGSVRLALACSLPGGSQGYGTVAYVSDDGGASWTRQGAGTSGTSYLGQPQSLTAVATGGGTLILGTTSGIYRLPPGAASWQRASVDGLPSGQGGISYVGMTSPAQGVALVPGQATVWMTTDGGQSWQPRPVRS